MLMLNLRTVLILPMKEEAFSQSSRKSRLQKTSLSLRAVLILISTIDWESLTFYRLTQIKRS